MKKIFLLILIISSFKSYSQYIVNQSLGSDSTLVTSKGALKSRIVNTPFTDTTQANTQRVKYYDGAQIYTKSGGGKFWIRDSSQNKWIELSSGSSSFYDSTLMASVKRLKDTALAIRNDFPVGSGITSLGLIGSTPNANGASISGGTLNLEPASINYGGVVTTGNQTFAGRKTFPEVNVINTDFQASITDRFLITGTAEVGGGYTNSFFEVNPYAGFITIGDDESNGHGNYIIVDDGQEGVDSGSIEYRSALHIFDKTSGVPNLDIELRNLPSGTTSEILYYNTTTKKITYGAVPSGGSGEANTISSLGGGLDIQAGKSGVDLQIRTLNSSHFDVASNLISIDASLITDIGNGATAFGWGNHASAGYQNSLSGTGIVKSTAGTISYLTDNSGNWDNAYTDRLKWDGGSTGLTASTGRTSLGLTTWAQNLVTTANPSAVRYVQINADNSVTLNSASSQLTALGGTTQTASDARYFQISNNLSEGTAGTMRTNLGATTIGSNFFTATNPSALGYFRTNADNSVTHRSYGNVRIDLGLVIGTDVQAYDADLDYLSTFTPTANVKTILNAADYAAIRTALGLVIGTNVQAYDTDLTTWAGITPATGVSTYLATPSSTNLRSMVTDENGTGALLFSGATSPVFVTPDLGTPSAVNLTNATSIPAGQLTGSVATARLTNVKQAKGLTLVSPTSSENVTIFYTTTAITIEEVRTVMLGSSQSVTMVINYGSSRASATGTIVASNTFDSGDSGYQTTGFAHTLNTTAIPAGNYIWFSSSATSGVINDLNITITYSQQ